MKKFGIIVAGSLLSLGAFAQEGVTLGGYVDAGYVTVMQDKAAGADTTDVNGFRIKEGAIYLGKKWGTEWEVFGDFSFGGNLPGSVGGVTVSQAFVAQMMENGFSWKLGQFDGVFGYYAGRADSHAHRLTDMGYISGAYLPANHLGWMGGYSFSDMLKVNLLIANDNEGFGVSTNNAFDVNTGVVSYGASSGTRHPDFGLLVNADFDTFSADFGAYIMTGEDTAAASADSEMGYSISAVVEGNFEPLTVGVYGVYNKNDIKDSGAAKNSGDFGIGANVAYDVNENFGADLRLEYVASSDKAGFYNPMTNNWVVAQSAAEVKSVMAATIGGHYKFNDSVKAKFDYTYMSVDADPTTGADADQDPFHIVQAGVVANF